MRDDQVMRLHELNTRREVLLLNQFEFLQTKIQAFEDILSGPPINRIRALFDWEWFKRLVDNRQMEILTARRKEFEEAQAKPKLKIVRSGNG